MSTEFLDKYKKLYSDYISHAVKLHNHNLLFCKQPSYEGGLQVRKALRNMVKLERQMVRINRLVFEEHKRNLREAAKLAKLQAQKTKRKKKNEQHNTTTTNNV